MDLGLAFEDEDLEVDEKNKRGDRDVPYNVKICTDQWFEHALQDPAIEDDPKDKDDEVERFKIEKFSADFHYYKKDYSTASEKYQRLSDKLSPKTSSSLWNDVQESFCRCSIYAGQTDQGLHIAREMVKKSLNVDETKQRQALTLLAFALEKAQHWAECVDALEQLCEMSPLFPPPWHSLGDGYSHFQQQQTLSDTDTDILLAKQITCYMRASLLCQSVLRSACDFIKERNTVIIQQLNTKIEQVSISQSRKAFAYEFVRKDIAASTYFDNSSGKDHPSSDKRVNGTFYEKFCSWHSHSDS